MVVIVRRLPQRLVGLVYHGVIVIWGLHHWRSSSLCTVRRHPEPSGYVSSSQLGHNR